jgi:hypothetical protein
VRVEETERRQRLSKERRENKQEKRGEERRG